MTASPTVSRRRRGSTASISPSSRACSTRVITSSLTNGGGPAHRSNRHLWCVVLATICRLYDRGFNLFNARVDGLVGVSWKPCGKTSLPNWATTPVRGTSTDVIKHCLWPLLAGPFREMLKDSPSAKMRTWLRNAYPVKPTS